MMDAKEVIQKGIDFWNAHDREAYLALFDEDISYVDQPTVEQFIGREAFGRRFYDLWMDAYPDNELKDTVIFAEGELVCLQARFVGTNTGVLHRPGIEMPPTNKPIDAPFVFIAEVRDGMVKRAWHYYDRLLAFEQEGILTVDKLFAEPSVA